MVRIAHVQTLPVPLGEMNSESNDIGLKSSPFPGFTPLTANFIYCPNQFFDLCLPHHSRGVVRLVAYILRRTLGWLDHNGNPVEQKIAASYQDLITQAGISRGAIGTALEEATSSGFIDCVQKGCADLKNQPSQTAQFTLRWDAGDYQNNLKDFGGFYAGEGYRTPIPDAFFDRIVASETLAVVKVVGAVLRHTVGYQNQFGGRRTQAPLSYSYIQKYSNISSRRALAEALRHAVDVGYIHCVQAGRFDPNKSQRSPASYSVRWLEQTPVSGTGSKRIPGEQSKKDTSEMSDRFKKDTSTSSKRIPANRFKKATKEKTELNNIPKQQQGIVAAFLDDSIGLLRDAGFDQHTANQLARTATPEQIKHQIAWLDHRNASANPLGMLRRAIEQDWPEPTTFVRDMHEQQVRGQQQQQQAEESARRAAEAAQKRKRAEKRQALLSEWRQLPRKRQLHYLRIAVDHVTSNTARSQLQRRSLDNPVPELLALMASDARSRE